MILKNTLNSDTRMTIIRLPKGQNIPHLTDTPNTQVRYYLQMNNYAIGAVSGQQPALFSHKAGDSVMIKAQFEDGAVGPFYGYAVNGNQDILLLAVGGGYVSWIYNGDSVAAVACDDKVHVYGWQGGMTGTTKWCKPWYDGQIISNTPLYPTGSNVLIGGIYMGEAVTPECCYSPNSWAVRIYEVRAHSMETGDWHLFACKTGNSHLMIELRNRYSRLKYSNHGTAQSGVTDSITSVDFPDNVEGYGIQLEDLQILTGKSFEDLMNLVCGDNGRPQSGADPADHVATTNNSDSQNYAFRMADGTNATISNPVPTPDGYSVKRDAQTNNRWYIKGDLIFGRSPRWNIWNDSIKWGKYTRTDTLGNRFYIFNIFKDVNANNLYELLARFEDYDTGANHAPTISVPSSMNGEFHNTVCCICTENNLIMGGKNKEGQSVYKYSVDALFGGNFNIGNLAPWNMSDAELQRSNLIFNGASVIIDCTFLNNTYVLAEYIAMRTENHFFNSASVADKTKFRDGNIIPDAVTFNDGMFDIFHYIAKQYQLSGNLPCRAQLGLIGEDTDDKVKTENVVPPKNINMALSFDTNHGNPITSTGTHNNRDRFLLGENGGVCTFGGQTYTLCVLGNTNSTEIETDFILRYVYSGITSTYLGTGIGCAVALGKNNALADIDGKIIAFIDIVMVHEDGTFKGRYMAFTMPESLSVNGEVAPYIERPYHNASAPNDLFGLYGQNLTAWPINKRVFYSADLAKTRACMWRWKDLLQSTDATQERPSTSGIAIPITSHIKVYENTTTNKGPVAWGLLLDQSGTNTGWDSNGLQYKTLTMSGHSRRLYLVNNEHVLPYQESIEVGDYVLILDCWFSIWEGSNMITPDTLPNMTIELKEVILHTFHQKVGTQAATSADITPTTRFTKTLTNTSVQEVTGSDNKRYKIQVSGNSVYQSPTILPYGNIYGVEISGFYNLRVWIHKDDYSAGSQYLFDPTF